MHASSYENMAKCYRRYIQGAPIESRAGATVLDVGGADVNGSYRPLFAKTLDYRVADLEAGQGVDIVLANAYALPLPNRSVDIVLSGQAFEHVEFFWRTFSEMVRVLKTDGFIFLIAPSAGPEHRYPVDCYRFYPDAYAALAKHAGCVLVEHWLDARGPWRDLVGVFRHVDAPAIKRSAPAIAKPRAWEGPDGTAAEERLSGGVSYRDVLVRCHEALAPCSYLEIGVRHGASLALARAPSWGVDPAPEVRVDLPAHVRLVKATSDAFFEDTPPDAPVDFAFIDGMHLFENALRDFMNIERAARPGAALLIDDVCPNHPAQAERTRRTRAWTGDVWKLAQLLRARRPDLFVATLDTSPTGVLLVAGLDPSNRILWDNYNPIVREWSPERAVPDDVMARTGAVDVASPHFAHLLATLGECHRQKTPPRETVAALRAVSAARPKLSVVVVSYNMPREIPRTIRSLSPAHQIGLKAEDYEIILVDNGSGVPFDEAEVRAYAPNLRIHHIANATPSPVAAINHGLTAARGDLIGVCIDGARMASPGLLAAALKAAALHLRPVIGTLAFHLGPDVQMRSVQKGYNQAQEDVLLEASGWERDGYKLFACSVFAGSSAGGWFVLPTETNALFMRAEQWRDLGGYDAGFVCAGGGLANLDMWVRACEDPRGELIMLLGEATFHQVHGGVATNGATSKWETFHEEYVGLRGKPFAKPTRAATYLGSFPASAAASLKVSTASG